MITLSELVGRKFFEKDLVEAEKKMKAKREVEEKDVKEKLERETDKMEKMDRKMGLEEVKDAEEKRRE
ncbi:hypothetical protein HBH89_253180 [Parastagonospora nodorum]|nr:hypothetical protein HBH89_253180 [Parastagonospora nodorum]